MDTAFFFYSLAHHVVNIEERVVDGHHRHSIVLKRSTHHKATNAAKSEKKKINVREIKLMKY